MDRAQGWRLAAREIEEAVIRILFDALTSPASLVEHFGAAGIPGDQVRRLLGQGAGMAAGLDGPPGERAKLVRELVVDEKTIIIKLRRGLLVSGDVPSSASEVAGDSAVELITAVAFTRRGAEPNWFCRDWRGRSPARDVIRPDQGHCARARVV
jgi:hypothetical protein